MKRGMSFMNVVEFMSCVLVTFFGHQFLREGHESPVPLRGSLVEISLRQHYWSSIPRFETRSPSVRGEHFTYPAVSAPWNSHCTSTLNKTKTCTQPINPYNFKILLTNWFLDRALFYTVHEILYWRIPKRLKQQDLSKNMFINCIWTVNNNYLVLLLTFVFQNDGAKRI